MLSFKEFLKEDVAFSPEEQEEGVLHLEISIPLFIRIIEFVREEPLDDIALHKITENMIRLQQNGVMVLGMDNYQEIIKDVNV